MGIEPPLDHHSITFEKGVHNLSKKFKEACEDIGGTYFESGDSKVISCKAPSIDIEIDSSDPQGKGIQATFKVKKL